MSLHRTLVAAAATAAVLMSTAATASHNAAAASVDVASVVVEYGDLNLNSERGVQRLQRRLVSAARQVCGGYELRDLHVVTSARACKNAAISRAVAEVGNPRLAQLNASRLKTLRS